MARKQKHGKATGKSGAPHTLDHSALAEAANRALTASRYKDAIELCKELCKRTPSAESRELLAAAYAGRAEDLAAKGMVKEAVTLWRNRADICGKALMEGPYPGWLRQIGDTKSLLQAYRACLQHDDKGEAWGAGPAAIEATLAGYALTAPDASLADLPVESPLVRSRVQARAAIEAYCQSDEDLDAVLKAIPFRSPYRDLARILKSLVRMETDPVAALDDLERIPANSPFARLAGMAKTAALPLDRWWPAVLALQGTDRTLALEFRHIPDSVRPLVDELLRLGERPAPGALFDWILRQRHRAPQAAIESLCRALLTQVPDRMRVYRQAFGGLADAEAECILALHEESKRDMQSAVHHWLEAVDCLRGDAAESARLRAALILRHLAELAPFSHDGGLHPDAIAWLRRSLEFDPDDVDIVLRLLPVYRERSDLKSARSLLDEALARFPKNANVLLEAIEVALAGNAFKKAVGYARRVLELDPINPRVRSLLGQAHMAHARKQIKGGKLDAASKELIEAAEWLRAPADRTALKRLQGIVDIEAGRVAEGQHLLNEAMAATGGTLLRYFLLAMEMARLGRDPLKSLRALGYSIPKTLAAAEVMSLVSALEHFKGEPAVLRNALAPLQKSLVAAAKQAMPSSDFLSICETFLRLELFQLVLSYAEAAQRYHPHSPVFFYHRVNARYGQRPWSIPDRDYAELTWARDKAAEAGDRRTAARIDHLLAPPPPAFEFDDGPLFDREGPAFDDIMMPQDAKDLLRLMDALGPEAFLDMASKMLGKKTFKQLEAAVGKEHLLPLLTDALGMSGGKLAPPRLPAKPKGKPAAGARGEDAEQGDLFDD